MLLEITTTHKPATDLGFLLHKNPANRHNVELSFGAAHVFYPEAGDTSCTVAMLLDIDPVRLVRGGRGRATGPLDQYVNDRPYAASSFMSVALARAFGTALAGNCKERPELVDAPLPLTARVTPVNCRAGAEFVTRLFEPLGYEVALEDAAPDRPDWEGGASPYAVLTLTAARPVKELLRHLYVLIPVLDNDKHYWIGDDEVEKLVKRGEGWLEDHPEKDLIVRRYLKNRRRLANAALARLSAEIDPDPDETEAAKAEEEEALETPIRLNDLRLRAVVAALKDSGARRVLDLGCSSGRLVRELLRERQFEEIVGLDVSVRALEIAHSRLGIDRMSPARRERIKLLHGSLMYSDPRIEGYDAAAVVEVIEHLDEPRLHAFEKVLFDRARPKTVLVTTPNVEFNATFENLAAGAFRHKDHRFEWTRAEFRAWADGVAERHGYTPVFSEIGDADPALGAPTQMAVFTR